MDDTAKLNLACFIQKLLKSSELEYMKEINLRATIHSKNTGTNIFLDIVEHRKTIFQISFSYLTSKIVNRRLSMNIKVSELSPSVFKRKYKSYLFYSYSSFLFV